MNLTAMKDIIADSIYYGPWPGALKRQSQTKSIVSGKINPKEELLFDKERINLNEEAIKNLYVSSLELILLC